MVINIFNSIKKTTTKREHIDINGAMANNYDKMCKRKIMSNQSLNMNKN